MGLNYIDLDEKTREYMDKELDLDIKDKQVNFSSYFNETGKRIWLIKLKDSIKNYDDDWLANQLNQHRCFLDCKPVMTHSGKTIIKSGPRNAAVTFAESEFNRLYIRGLCIRTLEEGKEYVVVYRGKNVEHPRKKSDEIIGKKILARDLLNDLRSSQGQNTALGIGEPNSGITVGKINEDQNR